MTRKTAFRMVILGTLGVVLLAGSSTIGIFGPGGSWVFAEEACGECPGLDSELLRVKERYKNDSSDSAYQQYVDVYNRVAACRKDGCDTGPVKSQGPSTTSVAGREMLDAVFTMVPGRAIFGESVEIFSQPSDSDGRPLQHTWFVNGMQLEELNGLANFTIDEPPVGEHHIRLVLEDDRGRQAEHSTVLTVVEQGKPRFDGLEEETELDWVGEQPDITWEDGESPYDSESYASEPRRPCADVYSSLEDAYEQYIASYKELTTAAAENGIWEPAELHEAQQALFEIRFRMEGGDRRAYQEQIAAINRLNSLLTKVQILSPPKMRKLQEDFFYAKGCYDEMLAVR